MWLRAFAALAGGLLLALSVPPWGWWPLAFVGAAALYLSLAGVRWSRRLLLGWLAGLGCFVPGLMWATAFNWYGALVLMVAEALSMGLAAIFVPPRHGRLVAFAGAFTFLEAVRMSWPLGGLPMGGVFLGQAGGPLLATARLGGPLLLTLEVWLLGGALGALAGTAFAFYGGEWLSVRGVAEVALPLVLVLALGLVSVLTSAGGPSLRDVSVAAVQGGGRRGTTAEEVDPVGVLARQQRETRQLVRLEQRGRRGHPGRTGRTGRTGQTGHTGLAGSHPRLVVWPEDVVSLSRPLAGSSQAATLSATARRLHATVLAGVTITISSTAFRNEVVAWGPDGHVVGVFEKVHRVPFGEYVPWRSFISHFANLSAVPRDAIPGHGSGLMRTPAGPLGLMVSFEVFFSSRSAASVTDGAQLLIVPTNTSSYSTSQVPSQEVAADRVQAVERGRDLLQASPTGYSTVVSPSGAVRRRSGLGTPALVLATVGLRDGRTVYDATGDWPVLALSGLLVLMGWWAAWITRSSRSGYRRRGSLRRRTWRGSKGHLRGPI